MGSPNSAKTLSKRAAVKRNRLLYWATESQSKVDSLEKDLADHPGILAPNLLKLKEEIPEHMAFVPPNANDLQGLIHVAAHKAQTARNMVDKAPLADLPKEREFFRSRILVEDTSLAVYNKDRNCFFPPELIKNFQGRLNEFADHCVLAIWTSIFASVSMRDGQPISIGVGHTYGKIVRVDERDPNLFGFDQWMPATQRHNARAMAYLSYVMCPQYVEHRHILVGEPQADWLKTYTLYKEREARGTMF